MKYWMQKFVNQMSQPLPLTSRVVLVALTLPILLAFTMPLWTIQLEAPQYPEGLSVNIYAHKVMGGRSNHDIAEINTLNHYIGMAPLDRAQLSDLDWIPFAFGLLLILTLRLAVIGNFSGLIDLTVMTLYFGAFSFARFAYKLYTLGHNLNPEAPVHLDPFMPVIIGTKQVANFTVSSYPHVSSIFIAIFLAGLVSLVLWQFKASKA